MSGTPLMQDGSTRMGLPFGSPVGQPTVIDFMPSVANVVVNERPEPSSGLASGAASHLSLSGALEVAMKVTGRPTSPKHAPPIAVTVTSSPVQFPAAQREF